MSYNLQVSYAPVLEVALWVPRQDADRKTEPLPFTVGLLLTGLVLNGLI